MSDNANAAAPGYGASVAKVAATLTAAIAASVLTGWILGIASLKSVLPGAVEMKPNTALGLIFAALSLYLLCDPTRPRRVHAGQFLALAVVLLGFATLAEYVFESDLRIDEILFSDTGPFNAHPGRMSPYSAAGFACLGLALACLPWQPLRPFVWLVASSVIFSGAVSALGYVWRASELLPDYTLTPVAVNTAVGFVLLGTGALVVSVSAVDAEAPFGKGMWSVERRVLIGFVAALLFMFMAGAFTYRAGTDRAESSGVLEHSQVLRQAVRHLYAALSDAESAQHGFLITGREDLREAHARHAARVRELEAVIQRLEGVTRGQQKAIEELKSLVERRLAELDAELALRERAGPDAVREALAATPGTQLMQSVSDATEHIARAEESRLAQREAGSARSRLLTLISLVLTFIVALGILLVLFRGIRREMAARAGSERALREANRFLDSIIENIPDMVSVKDAETLKYVRMNRAEEELLGHPRHELLGKADRDIFPRDVAERFVRQDREALAGGTVHDIPQETLGTGTRGERILHTKKIPIRDEHGQARYLLGISEDITEKALQDAEIRTLNSALSQRASQIEAVNKELESFSYSVSHDLRAPLRHINGYVELLTSATDGKLEGEPRRFLGVIAQASRQMGDLIDDLLAFSRTTRVEMHAQRVDLRATVQSVIEGLEMTTRGRNIEWRIENLPVVQGDPAMIKVIYSNLIGNAVKYTAPRDPARIDIGAAGEEDGRSILHVRDNGVGFDMKYAGKLFGIFQRLHHPDEFEGTGVGLATAQRIVARHGGRIWAEAAPGEGATFYFTLEKAAAGPPP